MTTTHTLTDLCSAYLADYHSDTTPKTRYGMEIFCRQLLCDFGPIPLTEMTTEAIRQWQRTQLQHLKSSTVHRKCARLSAMLRVAVKDYHWLTEHPMQDMRKPSPGQGRIRFLTDEEKHALLAACQRSRNRLLHPFVLLALTTGGRRDEIRCLRWSEVDLVNATVSFLRTKTKRPRQVPLPSQALDMLRALAAQRADPVCPWVFPSSFVRNPYGFEQAWRKARMRSGITDFRFHDLRHTYASYLAMSGASLRDIAELLGHVKLDQTMRYAHLLPSHTASIVERMARRFLV